MFLCSLVKQPRFETVVSELILVKNEALHAVNNLRKWMQPQSVERNLVRPFLHNIMEIFPELHNLFGGTFRLLATKKCIVLSR